MKGIILAAGEGQRLSPATAVIPKPLLPVYDKPMIYYPLSLLLEAGIREVLVVCGPKHVDLYRETLGSGSWLGIHIEYRVQEEPVGVVHALMLAESFVDGQRCCVVFGDNILYGSSLSRLLSGISKNFHYGARIFAHTVRDPSQFGVVEIADTEAMARPVRLIEKPKPPHDKTSYNAVPGLYFYGPGLFEVIDHIAPGYEEVCKRTITDVNQEYLNRGKLSLNRLGLGRGYHWHDAGTPESLLVASTQIEQVLRLHQYNIGCVEIVAYQQGLIKLSDLVILSSRHDNAYGNYIHDIAVDKRRPTW